MGQFQFLFDLFNNRKQLRKNIFIASLKKCRYSFRPLMRKTEAVVALKSQEEETLRGARLDGELILWGLSDTRQWDYKPLLFYNVILYDSMKRNPWTCTAKSIWLQKQLLDTDLKHPAETKQAKSPSLILVTCKHGANRWMHFWADVLN